MDEITSDGVLHSITDHMERMKREGKEEAFCKAIELFLTKEKQSYQHSYKIPGISDDFQIIHNALEGSVGTAAYQSYFKDIEIVISPHAVTFEFPGFFQKERAEQKYKTKVQQSINRLKKYDKKEIIFLNYKEKSIKEDYRLENIERNRRIEEVTDKKTTNMNAEEILHMKKESEKKYGSFSKSFSRYINHEMK